MKSKEVRIGIIGAVHDHFWPVWGKGMFHEFRAQPGVTLVAAAEQHPELQARLRNELGIERIYTDYQEMLDKEQLDAVLIALPSNAKVEPVRAAAKKGLHILMDKPLCTTMADAWEMKKIVDEAGVKLVVNSLSIWKAPLRVGFDLINEGAIGRPFWAKWRNANAGTEKSPGVSHALHRLALGYGEKRRRHPHQLLLLRHQLPLPRLRPADERLGDGGPLREGADSGRDGRQRRGHDEVAGRAGPGRGQLDAMERGPRRGRRPDQPRASSSMAPRACCAPAAARAMSSW